MSACQCRERIDALLAERNTRVMQVFTLGVNDFGMPWPVATEQVEKGRGKKKASLLFASYCPFCGVPVKSESDAAQQSSQRAE
ncbi:hypothetical protein [Achromobacter dolens]|uniref:hypothetical protein n=1 Tax=Achromobacter dolens TaxID=1287738 RepID=UPI000E311C02|nr:hypothetical protein [Achromobacter dolens]